MKYFLICISVIAISMFYFPFEFTFLKGINTKHMLAGFGLLCLGGHIVLERSLSFTKELIIASGLATIFSVWCFFATDYNRTDDYAYSGYIGSMWIWFLACYGACILVAFTHGYISVKLIVYYLLSVCVLQCCLALMIEFNAGFKNIIDRIFVTGDLEFMEKVGRLYGVGALLDVAGGRFSAVLAMTSVILMDSEEVRKSVKIMLLLIIGFFIVSVVGNMIARTTSIGVGLGLMYIFLKSEILAIAISKKSIRLWLVFVSSVVVMVLIAIFLYKTYPEVTSLMRFAFEGFFNWVETGTWETSSTEVLQSMWVFPDNDKTWLIGDGYFNDPITGSFYKYTDVGYLRFTYYSGLIGLILFSIFFIYLTIALGNRFCFYRSIFNLLLIIVFVNWLKVSTDIFLVYAFFLVISQPYFLKYYYRAE